MKSAWNQIESLLREERMYRGDTGVRLKDIDKLFAALNDKDASSDPKVGSAPNPEGDCISCEYSASPGIWSKWSRSPGQAKALAVTDRDQDVGRSQGATVMKKNYGGRIIDVPGKARGDFERQPSAMDRYDVIMVADVEGEVPAGGNTNFKHGEKAKITVRKIAWSPSIGSADERSARLDALLSGQRPPTLKRRPQPHIPEPSKDARANPAPQDVPRQGGHMGLGHSSPKDRGH